MIEETVENMRPMHSFAVCAYGDSPYLERCLQSLRAQSMASEYLLCTATPSRCLESLAKQYGFRLCVREGKAGIGADWNYAMDTARGQFVTLAHQDDIYGKHYTETLLRCAARWPDMELFMTRSLTLKHHGVQKDGASERIKRLLRAPLRVHALSHLPLWKKAVLRLGNPVICPSCAYRKDSCASLRFSEEKRFVLDWDYLYRLAEHGGRWICMEKPLLLYRVHPGAATAHCMEEHVREQEEYEMFCRMWPKQVASMILHVYRRAYAAYQD